MAASLSTLFSTLQTSLESASLPDSFDILPPPNGISLLDLKNELFLSYLQNLVFLILVKLRHRTGLDKSDQIVNLDEQATRKLAELRLYLEKGVKPLEGKLRYQIDKVIKAAEGAARAEVGHVKGRSQLKKTKSKARDSNASSDGFSSGTGSGSDDEASVPEIDELSYRPNPAAFARPQPDKSKSMRKEEPADGIYRPPRITATSMPITRGKEEKVERRPHKSATLDEFVATELSNAPVAEPSIGSTILRGGRSMQTQRDREERADRTRYEEEHLTRLPKQSKKERAKKGGRDRAGFGGEEWRGLDAGLDRIEALTKRQGGGRVERSKKRNFEGPGGGREAGEDFERRKKRVMRKFR